MSQYSEEIVYKCERYYLIDSKDEFKRAEEAAEITQLILELNDGELIEELKNRIFHNKSTTKVLDVFRMRYLMRF